MNKKVALSLLSATVFASMAASAFAAPKAGVYMGGEVDRYYALTDLFKLNDQGLTKFQSDLTKAGYDNIVFVDSDKKGAILKEFFTSNEDYEKIKRDLKQSDFEGAYIQANIDGTNGESYDPRKDITPEPDGELKVESVTTITKTGVTVNFPALAVAIEEATIEVKNNGTVVPVKAKLLDAGETTATFEFVTALTVDPAGTWTVNGVSFDANAQAAVAAVNAAAAGATVNEVKLLAALKSSYFKGVVDANITAYATEMQNQTYTSVADVQAAIDKVNTNEAAGNAAAAVAAAKNQVELLAALQNSAFKRVNADWIADYATYDGNGTVADYKEVTNATGVQNLIDTVNNVKVTAAITAAVGLDKTALATAKSLVNSYVPDTTDAEKAAKAALVKTLDIKDAVIKVNDAKTKASLKTALTNLAALDSTFTVKVNDALLSEYIAKFTATTTATNKDDASEIAILMGAVVTEQTAAAIDALEALAPDASDATVKAAFQRLADVTAQETLKFDMTTINDALLSQYRDAVSGTTLANLAAVQSAVATVNSPEATLDAIAAGELTDGTQITTEAHILTALKYPVLKLQNVKDENAAEYLAAKADFETAAAIGGTTPTATDIENARVAVQKLVNDLNTLKDVNSATTAAALKAPLLTVALAATASGDYLDLSTVAKSEVNQMFFDLDDADRTGLVAGKYTDVADVKTDLEAVTADYGTLLTDVNSATSISTMQTALGNINYSAFANLSADKKFAVAESFLKAFPVKADGTTRVLYENLTTIKADVDKAIAATN